MIKLGVGVVLGVGEEIVEPGGAGGCAGTIPGIVGIGAGVTVGVAGGAKVAFDVITVTVGAVGLVDPSHAATMRAATMRAKTTKALIRVMPPATATAIPRLGRRFFIAESRRLALPSDATRRSG